MGRKGARKEKNEMKERRQEEAVQRGHRDGPYQKNFPLLRTASLTLSPPVLLVICFT